ncbi:hypothetical protein JAAARDRAFT_36150, partial [Jaapia argillacea MUCL 33604]
MSIDHWDFIPLSRTFRRLLYQGTNLDGLKEIQHKLDQYGQRPELELMSLPKLGQNVSGYWMTRSTKKRSRPIDMKLA